MKRSLLVALAVVLGIPAGTASAREGAASLTGAGSTFVYPLVSQWIPAYGAATGVQITYSPIGSGGGIAQITARTVDFGASDAPLSPDQLAACKGCVQIPWALSATAVMYKLTGVKNNLRLTGRIIADIYLGKIKRWDDAQIRRLNPGVKLPSIDITPIYRSDGSGTTYNWTDYLSKVSPEFRSKVGVGTSVNFPTGVGGRGSSGVSGVLTRTEGGIAYADVAYALSNHLQFAAVQNRAGKFTLPGLRSIAASARTITKVGAGNEMHIVDPPKGEPLAYPICTFTYVILPTRTDKAPDLRRFVFWALTHGQDSGPRLLFQRIPTVVLVAAEKTLKQVRS